MLIYYAVVFLHVIVCFLLILVVLLQSGKGADLAGAFGGGATQTAFGSRGPASFLSKATTVAAVIFMFTSIALSGMSTSRAARSIMDNTKQTAAPVPAPKAPATSTQTKAPTQEEIKKQQEEIEARQKQAPAPASGTQKAPETQKAPAEKQSPATEKKAPGKSPA